MNPITTLTKDDYTLTGRRHGSALVARETAEAVVRWERDLAVLKVFGQTTDLLTLFKDMMARHQTLRQARPDRLALKEGSVRERNELTERAWALALQLHCILTPVAREDEDCATRLKLAMPTHDLELARGLGSLQELALAKSDRIPADVQLPETLEKIPSLIERLGGIFGQVNEAKGKPVEDTLELDELDGRLYVMMIDLNAAGRRAVRAGRIADRPPYYRFNHLRKPRNSSAEPAPAPVE
ncbi:hypothetical protein KKD52_04440 [Myxococcota bacterium]|nr:hypothetical protein [Myxococcota bacterium]MBU1509592.1 hypothetical protein [Myxococcota bacterium]